jgi:hypothetical protein
MSTQPIPHLRDPDLELFEVWQHKLILRSVKIFVHQYPDIRRQLLQILFHAPISQQARTWKSFVVNLLRKQYSRLKSMISLQPPSKTDIPSSQFTSPGQHHGEPNIYQLSGHTHSWSDGTALCVKMKREWSLRPEGYCALSHGWIQGLLERGEHGRA